jgi:hypothetical protein
MVLKARDYGFIGLKLKGLIFYKSGHKRARGQKNIRRLERDAFKENVGLKLTIMNKDDD